ncbi:MAG: leucyl aminopeptidase [Myxococcales bacterium]|nr:leucyl aminopeptidase [Myxococcales bacterium]
MRLAFVAPNLRDLDSVGGDVLACTVWQDAVHHQGVAALCDWRLCGRLGALRWTGFFTGELGQTLVLAGRPKLGFEKLLFFGAGLSTTFDEARFQVLLARMLDALLGLSTTAPVIELPGRQTDLIRPELAAALFLERTTSIELSRDKWTLVEDASARRAIEHHMVEERRRVRPVP